MEPSLLCGRKGVNKEARKGVRKEGKRKGVMKEGRRERRTKQNEGGQDGWMWVDRWTNEQNNVWFSAGSWRSYLRWLTAPSRFQARGPTPALNKGNNDLRDCSLVLLMLALTVKQEPLSFSLLVSVRSGLLSTLVGEKSVTQRWEVRSRLCCWIRNFETLIESVSKCVIFVPARRDQ